MPGVGSEAVAIERLKPANPPDEEADDINEEDQLQPPPSPPPPGRRPGVRTRIPQATDRRTRSMAAQSDPAPVNEEASSSSNQRPTTGRRRGVPNIDEIPPTLPSSSAPSNAQPHCAAEAPPPPLAPRPPAPQFFSDPAARIFSRQRRPNISYANSLAKILQQTLADNS